MKIVFITPTNLTDGGGVENVVKALADSLDQRGHEVVVYCSKNEYALEVDWEIRDTLTPQFPLSTIKEITDMDTSPDIIHSHLALPGALIGMLSKNSAANIVTSHGYDIQYNPEISYGMRRKWYYRILLSKVLPLLDRHLVVSKSMVQDAISSGSPSENIEVMRNPVPTPPQEIDSYAHENDYLLYIGRLHPKKNIPELVEIISDYLNRDEMDFLIAGKGDEEPAIRAKIQENGVSGNCLLLGYVDEKTKWELYSGATAFLINSTTEAFGISCVESMYTGTPVIARDAPPFDEYISNNENGYRFSDKVDIERAIQKVRQQRPRLAKNARRFSQNFTPEQIAKEHERIYSDIIHG